MTVAFVCVHNSCRSQMAEALGRLRLGDRAVFCSAGTAPGERIDPTAVRLVREHYGVDMEQSQYPKALSALPPVDAVITMGCGVSCPSLPCRYRADWGLADPSGGPEEAYLETLRQIEEKLRELEKLLEQGLPADRAD